MEHHPQGDTGKQPHPGVQQTSGTGSILREAREKLGLTVAEVAAQIKFAPRQIEALEADDYANLPEVAFLRGFVRSYAKILRLDAEALLANLPQAKAAVPELPQAPSRMPFPSGQSERQQNLIWLTAAALLALFVAGFSYWHYRTPLKHAKEPATEITRESSGDVSGGQPAPQSPVQESPSQDSQQQDSSAQESPAQLSRMQPAPEQQAGETPSQPEAAEKSPPTRTSRTARVPSAKMLSEPLVLKSSTIEPMIPKAHSAAAASSVRAAKTQAARRAAAAKAASAVPSVSPETSAAEPANAMTEIAELLLVFGEESWTEIKDRDGKVLSSQVNPPGSELRVEGSPPFSMLIGHAASATLFYQGREVDLKPYINQYSEVAHLKLK